MLSCASRRRKLSTLAYIVSTSFGFSSRSIAGGAFLARATTRLLQTNSLPTMVKTRRGLQTAIQQTSEEESSLEPPTKRKKSATKKEVAARPSPKKESSSTTTKKASSPARKTKGKPSPPKSILVGDGRRLLFSLRDEDELVEATLLCRPSKRNKSPYVGDIALVDEERNNINNDKVPYPLVHLPNLDMGGKCRAGVKLLVKPSRDRKGQKISVNELGKYGTPKCSFSCQLLFVDESIDGQVNPQDKSKKKTKASAPETTLYPPVWVGAHPSLGERIAEVWLREGLIEGIPPITHLQSQVTHPGGADMRADFCVHHADGTRRIVEIKTVVDTDYAATNPPLHDGVKCVFTSPATPYQRTAIFPWGSSNQKGPDGEKVVSARAIHHVGELAKLAQGELREDEDTWDGLYQATLLFVVIRGDAEAFRPNRDACPSFAQHVAQAKEKGVQILAKRVSWGEQGNELGHCYDDIMLPIKWN